MGLRGSFRKYYPQMLEWGAYWFILEGITKDKYVEEILALMQQDIPSELNSFSAVRSILRDAGLAISGMKLITWEPNIMKGVVLKTQKIYGDQISQIHMLGIDNSPEYANNLMVVDTHEDRKVRRFFIDELKRNAIKRLGYSNNWNGNFDAINLDFSSVDLPSNRQAVAT